MTIRAAFTYPWYPENWTDSNVYPATRYQPWPGIYDSSDFPLIRSQIAAMQYGNIAAGIASWWGLGSKTDQRFGQLLAASEGIGFQWCPYYEPAITDYAGTALAADLDHIYNVYAPDPAYLKGPDGRPVLFVYGRTIPGCPRLQIFMRVNAGRFYVNVQAQPSPIPCSVQPDSWHNYSPTIADARVPGFSYSISPGFWKFNQANPALTRDPARWAQSIARMVASGEQWQLITTFNEWVEGSAVENALDWQSASGQGVYLDALHNA